MTTATTILEREVLDFEKRYWDITQAGDYSTMDRITNNEFMLISGEGIQTFDEGKFVDMMRPGGYKIASYSIDESSFRVQELSPDVILAAYRVHQDFERNGKRRSVDSINSSVLVRSENRWRRAAHTITVT